jgi:hypothetical protein
MFLLNLTDEQLIQEIRLDGSMTRLALVGMIYIDFSCSEVVLIDIASYITGFRHVLLGRLFLRLIISNTYICSFS